MSLYVPAYMSVCTYPYKCRQTCTYVCMHICIPVCGQTYMYICVYIGK